MLVVPADMILKLAFVVSTLHLRAPGETTALHVRSKLHTTSDSTKIDHGLRGSASPVLTATGLVSGRWQLSTPHDRLRKILLQVITPAAPTAVPNFVQIRPWGLLDKWVKYNENFIYLYLFRELT